MARPDGAELDGGDLLWMGRRSPRFGLIFVCAFCMLLLPIWSLAAPEPSPSGEPLLDIGGLT